MHAQWYRRQQAWQLLLLDRPLPHEHQHCLCRDAGSLSRAIVAERVRPLWDSPGA